MTARRRFYVPFDGNAHPFSLGNDPEQLPIAELGIALSAEPGQERGTFKVYEHGQVLEEWAAVVGSARTSHGLVWYLCEPAELPGDNEPSSGR